MLGIGVYPITWPIFRGGTFRGVYHRIDAARVPLRRRARDVERRARRRDAAGEGDRARRPAARGGARRRRLQAAPRRGRAPRGRRRRVRPGALRRPARSRRCSSAARSTTSASRRSSRRFCELMPPPRAAHDDRRAASPPTTSGSAAFVFKIQANMDRAHRDRVAFVRICSGRFERGMKVQPRPHAARRSASPTRRSSWRRSAASSRRRYAGDVLGIYDPGIFEIGDTLTDGPDFTLRGDPELRARALRARS